MNWPRIAEIVAGVVGGLWLLAYGLSIARWALGKQSIPEKIDEAFYLKYAARAAKENWPYKFIRVFDIAINVLFRGQEDETISGRAYRASLLGKIWGTVLNYWLNLIQPQHGPKAMVGDIYWAQQRIAVNLKTLGFSDVPSTQIVHYE